MAKKHFTNHMMFLAAALIIIAISGYYALGYTSTNSASGTRPLNESVLRTRFAYLSQAHTNLCALPTFIGPMQNGSYIQGSCCGPMNLTSYVEQVNGLQNYSSISQIPPDPYNVSVSLAKELLSYQNLTLTAQQQNTYDMAVNVSKNHGPCCCRCWRWYAFEGLAKYLITHKNFNASQIATIWNLEDGCGG